MMGVADLQRLVGTAFPGGSFTIEAREHERFLRAVGAPPRPDGSAHPLYALVATQRGMGYSVDDFLAACGAKADDGPLLTRFKLVLDDVLRVGSTYTVTGGITDTCRKVGRHVGPFDLVTFELSLVSGTAVVARTMSSWALPRPET